MTTACVALAAGWTMPAAAEDTASVAQELAQMRAQMAMMASRIETLETQLAEAKAKPAFPAIEPAPSEAKKPAETSIAWKGAPELTGPGGWTFKPRGRLQLDAGTVSSPPGIGDASTGFGNEVRRAYLGFDGTIPGGFGYRAEIDVANGTAEITDFYLSYQASKALGITIGQIKPFFGLEEQTSDLFTSFTERAALNSAFGFERRVGISGALTQGDLLLQGGVFTDNASDLSNDENNTYSLIGRAVIAPKLGAGRLHLGATAQWRDLGDATTSVRYRVRPFIHTPDIRFVDTGNFSAVAETGYGLEAAYIRGPFHAAAEGHWQHVNRPGALADPTFFGGYAEVGMFLTKGDTRGYKGGIFDRIRPKNPADKGGIGAVQVNLRYDHLDLIDAGIVGGQQEVYALGLVWTPTDFTRFMLNYGHAIYDRAALPASGGDRSYAVDAIGARAQFDF
jgi:phosphate-selective porin OprO/OprP